MDEVYFIVVIHNVEPLQGELENGEPAVWCACASESYRDAETFQKSLLHTLGHGDRVVIIGANFGTCTGITDVKAVISSEVN